MAAWTAPADFLPVRLAAKDLFQQKIDLESRLTGPGRSIQGHSITRDRIGVVGFVAKVRLQEIGCLGEFIRLDCKLSLADQVPGVTLHLDAVDSPNSSS